MDAEPAVQSVGRTDKRKDKEGKKGSISGKGSPWEGWGGKAALIMGKAAVSVTPNPDAVGLGKAKNVIKEKPLPASDTCVAIRSSMHSASPRVSAGPSHIVKVQLPGAMQGVTLTRNELLEHPLWQPHLIS